jgi:predicted RNase H-like HicB family nuclease
MKKAYPIVLRPSKNGYYVSIPDFDIGTQGNDLAEAIYMARDAISMCGVYNQDIGRSVPEPTTVALSTEPGDIVSYVDVDFDAYRRDTDTTSERANVSLPRNMKLKAKAAGLSLSAELQARLREVLHMA